MYAQKQDINGKEREVWEGDVHLFLPLPDSKLGQFAWLTTIDPYDDTIYNSLQVPRVIEELTRLKSEMDSDDKKNEIDKLIQFMRNIKVGEFIRFVGD